MLLPPSRQPRGAPLGHLTQQHGEIISKICQIITPHKHLHLEMEGSIVIGWDVVRAQCNANLTIITIIPTSIIINAERDLVWLVRDNPNDIPKARRFIPLATL